MTLSPVLRTAALGLAAAASSLSLAHAADTLQVVRGDPAKDAYTSWPKQIRLTFNKPLARTGAEVQLMDPDGRRIRVGAASPSGDSLTVPTELTDGPPVLGPYMLTWQANAASGEQGKGDYTFFVR